MSMGNVTVRFVYHRIVPHGANLLVTRSHPLVLVLVMFDYGNRCWMLPQHFRSPTLELLLSNPKCMVMFDYA